MATIQVRSHGRPAGLTDRYAILLVTSLAGYAFLGKGYAYAGVPPLFVTEVALALGLLVVLHSGCLLASLASLPMLLLTGLFGLAALRTVPFLGAYGVDAVRDSMLVLYGLFALVTVALLLERPERVGLAVRFLQWFTGLFVFTVPIVYTLNALGVLNHMPGWPGSNTSFLSVRPGEIGVHVCGCVLMALLGLRTLTPAWTAALTLDVILIASLSRGGMLAIAAPVTFALVAAGRWRQMGVIVLGGAALLALLYLVDFSVPLQQSNGRDLNVRQIVDNLTSIAGETDKGDLDDNKEWRMLWWQSIQDYTFSGPYYWSGKGFGVNLAESDGFAGSENIGPPLRSPHNSHLTMLARAGVPGLALWGLLGLAWLATTTRCMRRAWRHGDEAWGNLMLLIVGYWLSIAIDAAFDVAIEGPMLGVWFWCLFGFGVGSTMIYETHTRQIGSAGRVRSLAVR